MLPDVEGGGGDPEASTINLDTTEIDSTPMKGDVLSLNDDAGDWDEAFVIDDIYNAISHGDLQPQVLVESALCLTDGLHYSLCAYDTEPCFHRAKSN